jgi:hypothetical protein
MDPNTVVAQWLNDENLDRESIDAFNDWRARGGFAPTVAIAAHTDLFMMGERFGTVEKLTKRYASVKGTRSKKLRRLSRDSIERVLGGY